MTSHAGLLARFTVRIRNRAVAATGAVLCLALPLTGCSDGGSDDAAKPAAPSQSRASTIAPSPADPQATEKKAVLSAYSSYWQEQVTAYKTGSVNGTRLKKYAAGAAVARVESDLASMKDKDVTTNGRPSHDVRVTALATSKQVPSATLSDCLDISDWKWTYRTSGAAVPSPKTQLTQYRTIVKAEKWGNQWMILSATPQATKCTHG
ncbi:hypothetical protein [Streptomyces sp. NBC_01462]|uniref:hypothetical protein n=1 Tax=Streptomyces sp. NBC_01462 TaxID=2903876 RepID=UPI002E3376E2|nr:hypothetical protein [Streptomyces sp. NBC_01462]